jgi:hypothetical protein
MSLHRQQTRIADMNSLTAQKRDLKGNDVVVVSVLVLFGTRSVVASFVVVTPASTPFSSPSASHHQNANSLFSSKFSSNMAFNCLKLKAKAVGLLYKIHDAFICKIYSRVLICFLPSLLTPCQQSTTKPSSASRTRLPVTSNYKIVLLSTPLLCAVPLLPQRSCLAADSWAAWKIKRTGQSLIPLSTFPLSSPCVCAVKQ